eukprot:7422153-Pyramimonas_sp.AAC.2
MASFGPSTVIDHMAFARTPSPRERRWALQPDGAVPAWNRSRGGARRIPANQLPARGAVSIVLRGQP